MYQLRNLAGDNKTCSAFVCVCFFAGRRASADSGGDDKLYGFDSAGQALQVLILSGRLRMTAKPTTISDAMRAHVD